MRLIRTFLQPLAELPLSSFSCHRVACFNHSNCRFLRDVDTMMILFLTNSVLTNSRYFCLKEISWALEFGKPIFVQYVTAEWKPS